MSKLLMTTRGIVGVYKPKGPTSHWVINQVRKITGEKKVGHAGTLDPLAEGVLVIGIGREATRELASEVKKEKEYVAEIKLGATTETDDSEGSEVPKQIGDDQIPNMKQIEAVLKKFEGEIWQTPPDFSAVKVKGKEAYKLKRKGKEVKLDARKREIKKIELMEYDWPILKLRVVTGPGVYIRSLARDVGEGLKVGGYLQSLKRVRVGQFELGKALVLPTDFIDVIVDKNDRKYFVATLTKGVARRHCDELVKLWNLVPTSVHTKDELLADERHGRRLWAKWQHSLAVKTESKIVGLLLAYEREGERNQQYPKNTVYLNSLAIDENYQGMGIGRALIEVGLKHSRKIGFRALKGEINFTIQTNSADWNGYVVELYKSVGFIFRATKEYADRVDLVLGLAG